MSYCSDRKGHWRCFVEEFLEMLAPALGFILAMGSMIAVLMGLGWLGMRLFT